MRNRFTLIAYLFTVILLIAASKALAEFRVATIDVNRVINETKAAKTKRDELDKMTADAKELIKTKNEKLEKTRAKLQSGEIKPDSKEAQAFREEAREFSRFVQDKEKEIQGKFNKVNRDLTKSVITIVENYAKENKIDLVLNKPEEGRGPVLYGETTSDITQDIVKLVNK